MGISDPGANMPELRLICCLFSVVGVPKSLAEYRSHSSPLVDMQFINGVPLRAMLPTQLIKQLRSSGVVVTLHSFGPYTRGPL